MCVCVCMYIYIYIYIGSGQRSRAAYQSEIPELPTADGEWRYGPDTGQRRWTRAFVQRWVKANRKLTVFLCCLALSILFAGIAVRRHRLHGPLGSAGGEVRGPLGRPGVAGNQKSNVPSDGVAGARIPKSNVPGDTNPPPPPPPRKPTP